MFEVAKIFVDGGFGCDEYDGCWHVDKDTWERLLVEAIAKYPAASVLMIKAWAYIVDVYDNELCFEDSDEFIRYMNLKPENWNDTEDLTQIIDDANGWEEFIESKHLWKAVILQEA